VDDDVADTNAIDVTDWHLDDGESVLLGEGFKCKEVGLEAGITRLMKWIVAVSVDILGFRNEGY
jgi:hypothetical protein